MNKTPKSDGQPVTWISIVPKIGWLLFVVILCCFLFPDIKILLGKVSSFKGYGVEIELKESIDKYNQKHLKQKDDIINKTAQDQLIRRVDLLGPVFKNKTFTILWVDDHPENNTYVAEILTQIGFKIENSTTNASALQLLEQSARDTSLRQFDLIISDFGKDDPKEMNGIEFSKTVKDYNIFLPVIIYSASFEPAQTGLPSSIFAYSNRPDFLINYILDAVERGGTPFPTR